MNSSPVQCILLLFASQRRHWNHGYNDYVTSLYFIVTVVLKVVNTRVGRVVFSFLCVLRKFSYLYAFVSAYRSFWREAVVVREKNFICRACLTVIVFWRWQKWRLSELKNLETLTISIHYHRQEYYLKLQCWFFRRGTVDYTSSYIKFFVIPVFSVYSFLFRLLGDHNRLTIYHKATYAYRRFLGWQPFVTSIYK